MTRSRYIGPSEYRGGSRADTTSAPVRLNWGCGASGMPGWINSDRKQGPHIQISCDIREGLPIPDASFDYAVSVHALPELVYPDIVPALRELRRVLRPGGTLRLGLPDMDRAIEAYRREDRDYFLVPDDEVRSIGGKLIVQLIWYGYSRTLFTSDFIQELMEAAGFREVRMCEYGKTRSRWPGIVELDDRERESLFVEGVR